MLQALIDRLEQTYGPQTWLGPTEPYAFLIWLNCGYPPSDAACAKGFASLVSAIETSPEVILGADEAALAAALAPGGMVPDLRARRLNEIAARVGELSCLEARPLGEGRKVLMSFPTIGASAADRILLFCGIAPLTVFPSGALHVLLRLGYGEEVKDWGKTYALIRDAAAAELLIDVAGLQRAYLLLKAHAQVLCRKSKPRCLDCPLRPDCAWYHALAGAEAPGPE
jgi:endonuclease III